MISITTCDALLLVIFIVPTIVLAVSTQNEQRSTKSILNSDFNGHEILEGEIIRVNGFSLIRCSSLCTERPSCLSLNYNKITNTCVLFDKDFTDLTVTSSTNWGDSWFYYYVIRDAEMKSVQCNSTFTTDICSLYCMYFKKEHGGKNYAYFESHCNAYDGGEMVIIDRQLKHHCVKELAVTNSHNVYIQGKRNETTNVWTYNDGRVMTFFNWKGTQPENRANEIFLGLMKDEGYLWDDVYDDSTVIHATVCQQT